MDELDITTQTFLGSLKSYKAKVWFFIDDKDSYSIGLRGCHKNKETYISLSKEEAIALAEILSDYANKIDSI